MSRGVRHSLLGIVLSVVLSGWAGSVHAEFYAVVVGVADYPGTANDLSFTDDDALGVRDALLAYPNWSAPNVTLLLDSDATKGNVQAAIDGLRTSAGAEDVFVFFFSGHGTTGSDAAPADEVDGFDEYLCTYGNTMTEFIRDDELEAWLGALPTERIVVLIDTCFAGGQMKGVRSLNTGPAPRAGDGFTEDLRELVMRPTKQDLDDLTAKQLVVLAAADDHEYAYELGHPYNHGLFSYFLIEGMNGAADGDANGAVSGEECFAYLEPRVLSLSDAYHLNQHPQLLDTYPGELEFLQQTVFVGCWEQGVNALSISGTGAATASFGVDPSGSDCLDIGLDLPAPPPVPDGEYTRAWLELDSDCDPAEALRSDVRASVLCEELRTWTLHVEDAGPAVSVTISWDLPLFDPMPSCLRRVVLTRWPATWNPTSGSYEVDASGAPVDWVNMLQTGSYTYEKGFSFDHSGFTVTVDCRSCFVEAHTIGPQGWHMTAFPGQLCGDCFDAGCGNPGCALADDLPAVSALRWDPAVRAYVEGICYVPGMSLWTHTFGGDGAIDAEVVAASGTVELPLEDGWNQVGNPYTVPISASALSIRCDGEERSLLDAQAAEWISATLYGYDTAGGDYVGIPLDTGCLPPWTGCWLRAYRGDCSLVIRPVGCAGSATMSRPRTAQEIRARGLDVPPPPPSIAAAWLAERAVLDLTVQNLPNPVRSEHTTTFVVAGRGADRVEAIRVDIYDQAGARVFTQQIEGTELDWHTVNGAGELLANGAYLYETWVKIGGHGWISLGWRKLAVVR